jgi:carbon monoxide dehydrogenase subunit G
MRFEEQIEVPASVDEVWEFLWQVQTVAACLPGCVSIREVEPERSYVARFEDKIGPYKVAFDMNITVDERIPLELVRLLCTGEDRKLRTSQRVSLEVRLHGMEEGTRLEAVADVVVLGVLATLGQFVVKRKAREVVEGFAANLRTALTQGELEGSHA